MAPPSVAAATWLLAAVDPVLIAVAAILGWKADQFGKVFLAVIAAVGAAVLCDWALTAVGLPSFAPVARDAPMLLPVRSLAALAWAVSGYGARRLKQQWR